ncbi:hypothetical protein BGZ50_003045 [Haplosporangium sp. Z 11]|nr:hypothetical protein BGZ50_003045 [Haplosporangium sp. Z 11]
MEPIINATEFCDWRVQTQGNCQGVTYVSFLYTTRIIASFLFLFISVGTLVHNIWWKGQKIWEFSRSDRSRPTEGFVFWCAGYFSFRCVLSVLLLVGVHEEKRGFLENFADLPWVFVSGAMGFYLVGIIYATPASFSSYRSLTNRNKRTRPSQEPDSASNTATTTTTSDKFAEHLALIMEPKRVYLPTPMVLNFTLFELAIIPLIVNQTLASFAGSAYDRGNLHTYGSLISAMYGIWVLVVDIIFALYIFFGKQLLTIISSNMGTINNNVGRVSSRVGTNSECEDSERQLNTLKSTYQRMRAILILCGSLSPIIELMMLFFALYREKILNSVVASEAFSLVWIYGAR